MGLQDVLKPIETANGLENAHYIDADMHDLETQKLLKDGWMAIGFGHDVAEPGCVYPVELAGHPLLIARDKAGVIRVFQNVCRHRGMILVNEPAKLNGPITCPYHAWAYDFKGQLRATPHAGGPNEHSHESVPCEALSLHEVRSYIWRDVVYVNMSGDAPDFEDYAQDLMARWQEFDKPLYFGGADSTFTLDIACNWKLAVENYCEAYHLPFIHPGLNSYSRLEDHYNILDADNYAGQGSNVYNPQISADGRQFPSFDGLSAKWDLAAEYCALFPNVLYGTHKDHFFAIILTPLGQHRTLERIALYYADEAVTGPDYADMRETNSKMWKEVFVEDIQVVEGMQKGRNAPAYDGGKFSAVMDAPTHHFHRWVANQLSD